MTTGDDPARGAPGEAGGPDYSDPSVAGAARDEQRPRRDDDGDEEPEARDTGLQTGDVKEGNTLVDPGPGD